MKNVFTLLLLVLPIILLCQNTETKPAKIRYSNGFFNTKWEIGDKDVVPKDVQLHLDKYDNEASFNFKRADALEKETLIFTLIGSVGMLVGVLAKDGTSLIGYSSAVVFYGLSLGTSISSKKKYDKAVNGYNKKFGY